MNWLLAVTACAYALNTGLGTAYIKWKSLDSELDSPSFGVSLDTLNHESMTDFVIILYDL